MINKSFFSFEIGTIDFQNKDFATVFKKFRSSREQANQIISDIFRDCNIDSSSLSSLDTSLKNEDLVQNLQMNFAYRYLPFFVRLIWRAAQFLRSHDAVRLNSILTREGIFQIEAIKIEIFWPQGFSEKPLSFRIFFSDNEKVDTSYLKLKLPGKGLLVKSLRNPHYEANRSVDISAESSENPFVLSSDDFPSAESVLTSKLDEESDTSNGVCCTSVFKVSNHAVYDFKGAAKAIVLAVLKHLSALDEDFIKNWKQSKQTISWTAGDCLNLVFRVQPEPNIKSRREQTCRNALEIIEKAFSQTLTEVKERDAVEKIRALIALFRKEHLDPMIVAKQHAGRK